MSAGNLLVVDDDQNLIELIGLKLKAEGYEVTTAATGQEAVQAAKAAIFDLCIVDLRLSDQDGISVMRELHSINPGMRVIILTGYGTVESADLNSGRIVVSLGAARAAGILRGARTIEQTKLNLSRLVLVAVPSCLIVASRV